MRTDRLSSLRQRLRRGSFDFEALRDGVSTLETEDAVEVETSEAVVLVEEAIDILPDEEVMEILPTDDFPIYDPEPESEPVIVVPEELPANEEIVVGIIEIEDETPVGADVDVRNMEVVDVIEISNTIFADQIHAEIITGLFQPTIIQDAHIGRLHGAIESLSSRLLTETNALKLALASKELEEAGFHLAHLNQVLELLATIDDDGSLGREYLGVYAPPAGRSWPSSSWSVAEFVESPFSALLPVDADEEFVRKVVYAAWGVTFETG